MTPALLLLFLDWMWHRVAVAAAGYLLWGWRGSLAAIVLRELFAIGVSIAHFFAFLPSTRRDDSA